MSRLCLVISITTLTCQSLALPQNRSLITLQMVSISFIFTLIARVVANSYFAKHVRNLLSTIGSVDRLDWSISKSIILSVSSRTWPRLSPMTGRISRPVFFGWTSPWSALGSNFSILDSLDQYSIPLNWSDLLFNSYELFDAPSEIPIDWSALLKISFSLVLSIFQYK